MQIYTYVNTHTPQCKVLSLDRHGKCMQVQSFHAVSCAKVPVAAAAMPFFKKRRLRTFLLSLKRQAMYHKDNLAGRHIRNLWERPSEQHEMPLQAKGDLRILWEA